MTISLARILLVDSNADAAQELRNILSHEGYNVSSARDPQSARRYFEQGSADLTLTDLHLPQADGLTFLTEMRTRFPNMPVVLMTANGSLRTAVEGLKAGAFDYLTKPFIVDEVRCVARRALEHSAPCSKSPAVSDRQPDDASPFGSLIGSSPGMVHVYKAIARVAQTDCTVLLQGESGTGKELIARAIHASGPRSGGPFVTVDGGALADTLLESELFGHERGSFTGAVTSRKGLLEKAHSGTCFLDEAADLSPAELMEHLYAHDHDREANAVEAYKQAILDSAAADVVYTPYFSGVHGNYLKKSIVAAGLDPDNLPDKDKTAMSFRNERDAKAWKDIWGAGQGVGNIADVLPAAELVARLRAEYRAAKAALCAGPF